MKRRHEFVVLESDAFWNRTLSVLLMKNGMISFTNLEAETLSKDNQPILKPKSYQYGKTERFKVMKCQ